MHAGACLHLRCRRHGSESVTRRCLPLCLFSARTAARRFFYFFIYFFSQTALNRPSRYNSCATFTGQTAFTRVPCETALNSPATESEWSSAVSLPLCTRYYGASVLLLQHVGGRGRAVTFTLRLKHLDQTFIFLSNEILDEKKMRMERDRAC